MPASDVDLTDPQALARLLHDANTPADLRELAAARLVALGTQQAIDELAGALRPGTPAPAQMAAASAVVGAPRPDPRLIEPLLALLTAGGPANIKREAGRALGSYRGDPTVAARLAELAVSVAPSSTRQGAVAGLARIPSKSSAQTLMVLLDGDAPEALEREAAEALRMMTGQEIAADDLAGWQAWWEQVQALDETAFKAMLLEARTADVFASARRADAAAAALLAVSQQRYRALAAEQKPAMLEEYLRSSVSEMRETAVRLLLREEVDFAHDVAPGVMRLVRAAIIDPDGRVRTIAALIVQRRNDTEAVDLLLAQVPRESLPAARLEQIRALGSLGDPRALPTLLGLLTNSSAGVRTASARAAAGLANTAGPDAVRQAAAAIRLAFEETDASRQGGQRQRAELLNALADLNEPSLASFYRTLLAGPVLPREVLAPALRGVATLGDTNLNNLVLPFISSDYDAQVREQAVRALGKTSLGFERYRDLRALLIPANEPADQVRRAAWEALVELFPKARTEDLTSFSKWLQEQGQYERQLIVLKALADEAEQAQDFAQLAWHRHAMAEVLMDSLDRPGEAADLWRLALEYNLEHGGAGTLETRAQKALRCYLRARRFEDAIKFSNEMISMNASFRESVGIVVKSEAQTFADGGQPEEARALIDAVLREDPPLLDPLSQSQLKQQRDRLPAP